MIVDADLEVAPNDVTVEILNRVLGTGWHNLFTAGAPEGGTGVLFAMLAAMNDIALVALGVIVVGVTVSGIMETANEGKPFGERWHTLWVPLRIVVAAAMLIPIPGVGLSVLQGSILTLTYSGIGLADYMWNISVDYMVENAGHVTVRAQRRPMAQLMEGMVLSSMAQHFAHQQLGFTLPRVPLICKTEAEGDPGDGTIKMGISPQESRTVTTSFSGWLAKGGLLQGGLDVGTNGAPGVIVCAFPIGALAADGTGAAPPPPKTFGSQDPPTPDEPYGNVGVIHIDCPEGINTSLCAAKEAAIVRMAVRVRPLAAYLASQAMGALDPDLRSVPQPDPVPPSMILQAERQYHDEVEDALEQFLMSTDNEYSSRLREFGDTAKQYGWGLAGAWYWTISRYNDQINSFVRSNPSWSASQLNEFDEDRADFAIARDTSQSAVRKLIRKVLAGRSYHVEGEGDDELSSQAVKFDVEGLESIASNGGGGWLSEPFVALEAVDFMTANEDPLIALQTTGDLILDVAAGTVLTVALAKGVLGAGEETFLVSIGAGFLNGVLDGLSPYITAGVVALFVAGLTLAIYLPAVPMIMWTISIVGWLILVFESVAAAPLWAVGHALPEGQGFAGQWGRQGYLLLLGVLIRPPLMMLAFWMSVLMMFALGEFLNLVLHIGFTSMRSGSISGFFTMIGLLALATGFLTGVVHRVYGIIPTFPQAVMQWLSITGNTLGEDQAEGKASGSFAAAAGVMQAGGRGRGPGTGDGGGNGGGNGGKGQGDDKKKGKDGQVSVDGGTVSVDDKQLTTQ